ncbi:NAD-dependent epimerase/dehydratase family protein [Anditalea andensis]|uniref:Dihydroflavonol 4-reductase n=1 Tax=Anditalea andensis TaxID=1048983 RepID=A0A074KQC0_9BACT|nr:NAD-dependent epimerase/dehydratase family protein [Anditalea andensis]KEO72121.1 dihydroflavonol 4-reductase [Anditalea andensis]
MKILITGITGLFGSYLAREFLSIGEIHGMKRKNSSTELLEDIVTQITWHDGDVGDYQSLESAIEGMDVVIHAAGMVSFLSADEEKLLQVNVEGTANVVNVMLETGVNKLFHISSVAALGRNGDDQVIDENHKWAASPLNTAYSISKYLGELEVWRGAQEGLDVLVVNPSVLLGKLSDKRSSSALYRYVIEGNRFYPKGRLNYIDIRDAASISLQLFKEGKWNERYILNKESIGYKEFFHHTASKAGVKPPQYAVSDRYLGLASVYFKIKGLFVRVPFNKEAAKTSQYKITFDNAKTNLQLQPSYRTLDETLSWALGNEN